MDKSLARFRQLDSEKIIATVEVLQRRIVERFPGSGLGNIVSELRHIAEETVTRTAWIQKPHLALRIAAITLSLGMVALVVAMVFNIREYRFREYTNSIQALEATISSVVFIGAAILFLVSWENRIKRKRALEAIHELRAMAHIVDMHQLTKDPESCFGAGLSQVQAPRRLMTPFELNRYLDYASEALALISKIAALYVQGFQDTVLLDAVDDVEDLTSGFSRKIWQKITILENLGRTAPAAKGGASA